MILEKKTISCLKPQLLVYIQDLEVCANERNNGIGTLLMNASKKYGEGRGVDFTAWQKQ